MNATDMGPNSGRATEPLLRPVMPELDSIRGLAILMVLFYHGFYVSTDLARFSGLPGLLLKAMWTGRMGVNLFFVLSGFLITGLLVDSKNREDYYSRFYIRRALRILPAYLLTLAIVIFAYGSWKFVVLSLLYLSNLTPLFGIAIAYPVLWSLAVEEHFYLIWPMVVRRLKLENVGRCCLLVILLSPLVRLVSYYAARNNGPTEFVWNEYTWNSVDGLACGALFALWLKLYNPSRREVGVALAAIGGIAAAVWLAGLPWGIWTRHRPVGAGLQIVPAQFLFVCLLGAFLLLGTSRWSGFVQAKPLRFFGEISYGLYLYHTLAFDGVDYLARRESLSWVNTQTGPGLLTRFVLASLCAIAVAFVSRRTLEDWFLGLKKKLTPG